MAGGVVGGVTDNTTLLLITLPTLFETMTEYVPALRALALLMVSVAPVCPIRFVPFNNH